MEKTKESFCICVLQKYVSIRFFMIFYKYKQKVPIEVTGFDCEFFILKLTVVALLL